MKTSMEKIAAGIDAMMDVDEAASFIRVKKSWLYQLVMLRRVPCYHSGRRVLFSRLELSEWLLQNRRKTLSEIDAEAANHLS